jgi:3-oxoacyl-ACP reductase-like protein
VQSTDFINKNIENITKQYDVFAENQKNIVANYTKKLDEFSDTNEINFEKYSLRQEELSNSYNKTISEMITGNADRIQKLDAELGQELNKALESLGSNLTSLSQHFVNDYKPLTESLKRVVEMSRDIEK